MSSTISVSEEAVFVALKSVLDSVGFTTDDAAGLVPVIKGQVNRVPSPIEPDYLVMWPLLRDPIATNIDDDLDTTLHGSITSNVLVVSAIDQGIIYSGLRLYGTGLSNTCRVLRQLSGAEGGIGNYAVSATPNLINGLIRAGTHRMLQLIELAIQCDIHGPNSADNATRMLAMFRDGAAVQAFADLGLDIAPLYLDTPRQMPFENAEAQWEDRWVLDLHLQINPVIAITQQFADELAVDIVSVEATFPP